MSHQDYVANLDEDQLHSLVSHAQSKLKELESTMKEKYLVVSDGWINVGFFRMDNANGAGELVVKLLEHGKLFSTGDEITVRVEKWYAHEVEDLIVEKE